MQRLLLAVAALLLSLQTALAVPADQQVVIVTNPVVSGEQIDRYGTTTVTVGREQVEGLNALDLPSALQRVPGVTISRYNLVGSYGGGDGGAVFIRGMGASRPGGEISTMVDGIPLFVGVWTHPLVDVSGLDHFATIQIEKSPQPVLGGNMSYGSVNLVPERRSFDGYSTSLQVQGGSHETVSSTLRHHGRTAGFSYGLTGTFRQSDGHRENAGGQVFSGSASLGYDFGPSWNLRAFVSYSDAEAEDPEPLGTAPFPRTETFSNDNLLGVVTLSHDHNDVFSGHLKFSLEDGSIDWEQWNASSGSPFDTITNYDNVWVRARETMRLWRGGEVVLGYDFQDYGGETYTEPTSPTPLEERLSAHAPYLLVSHTFGSEVTVTPSLGYRYHTVDPFGGESGYQAGLTIGWGRSTFALHGSRSFNFPGVYAYVQYQGWNRGEQWEDLEAEDLLHYQMSYEYRFTSRMALNVSIYRSEVSNGLRFVPPPPPPPAYANIGAYDVTGGEASFTFGFEGQDFFVGLGVMSTSPEEVPQAPGVTGSFGWTGRFVADRLKVTLNGQFVDEQYVLNPRFNGPAGQVLVDSHVLANLRLGYEVLPLDRQMGLEVFAVVDNLLDEEYAYRPGYPMPGTTFFGGMNLRF